MPKRGFVNNLDEKKSFPRLGGQERIDPDQERRGTRNGGEKEGGCNFSRWANFDKLLDEELDPETRQTR